MTEETPTLYRVYQLGTQGWENVEIHQQAVRKLTKEQCDQVIRDCLDAGVSPDKIKVVVDTHTLDE